MVAQPSGLRKFLSLAGLAAIVACPFQNAQAIDPNPTQPDPFGCSAQVPQFAQACIRQHISAYANDHLHTQNYNRARERMFQYVDAYQDPESHEKVVKSVYTTDVYPVGDAGIPQNGVNAEHSFCQSWLKPWPRFRESRSDLFHIFPLNSHENSRRNNVPFADCTPNGTNTTDLGIRCDAGYEPPDMHKGKLARAMFYVSVAYNIPIDDTMEGFLREWAHNYGLTTAEVERASRVTDVQGNHNPFIDHPEWIDLISNY